MNLISFLKHTFVPQDKNNYTPHLFREFGVSIVIFTSVFLLGASFGSSLFLHRTVLGVQISSDVLIDLTNESRLAYNQMPLIRSEKLDQAAELKGRDMADKQYFSHNSPEGVTPWHWIESVGYNFLYAGENLAIDFTDATDVEKAWLASPAHRANIMSVDFREIGIAAVEGVYKGNPTMYIVQMFGTPAHIEPVHASAPASTQHVPSTPVVVSTVEVTSKATGTRGVVAGSSTEIAPKVPSSQPSGIEYLVSTQDIAIVKNTSTGAISMSKTASPAPSYSSWYDRLLFNGPKYIDIIYKAFIIILSFGLVTLITVEVRKQHPKHILYGVLSLVILLLFVYINQSLIL